MTRFIEIDGNPAPAGGAPGVFVADDGARLRTGYFPAPAARGTAILAPGWSEFIEKYFESVRTLNDMGLNVAMMDWRGQGLSEDPLRWTGYFDRLADDLKAFREGPVAARFEGPFFLLTHSMGGLPALLLLKSGYEGFARAALCAPMTRLFPGMRNEAIGLAAGLAVLLGLEYAPVARADPSAEDFAGNIYTSDRARHDRFKALKRAEPMAVSIGPSFGWVREAVRTSRRLHAPGAFDALKVPVRIISAEKEQRVDAADQAAIAGKSPHIDHVVIPDALHEIMMERDDVRAAFWAAVAAFFAPALAG